jgi:hypothetical protein
MAAGRIPQHRPARIGVRERPGQLLGRRMPDTGSGRAGGRSGRRSGRTRSPQPAKGRRGGFVPWPGEARGPGRRRCWRASRRGWGRWPEPARPATARRWCRPAGRGSPSAEHPGRPRWTVRGPAAAPIPSRRALEARVTDDGGGLGGQRVGGRMVVHTVRTSRAARVSGARRSSRTRAQCSRHRNAVVAAGERRVDRAGSWAVVWAGHGVVQVVRVLLLDRPHDGRRVPASDVPSISGRASWPMP